MSKKLRRYCLLLIVVIAILFLLIGLYIFICRNHSLDSWIGDYYYIETFPHGQDENFNYFIAYEISIYKEDGQYYAKDENDGWFTQTRTLAEVIGNKNRIDIVFKETLPGDSLYGICERYDEGEVLVTLYYENGSIQTAWGVLRNEHPVFTDNLEEIKGEYFIKSDMNEKNISDK